MGIGIAGALSGVSNAMQQEHREQFETDQANRRAAMGMWQQIINDPNATPEHKKYALAAYMGIAATPSAKNWSKYTKPYDPQAQAKQPPPQSSQPGITLAPQAPANPGPQAPVAAGGGTSPGVLQGGANQLPPLAAQPSAPQPGSIGPPPPPAPDISSLPSGAAPVTLAPPPNPVLDPNRARGYYAPGEREAQALSAEQEAQLMARANVYERIRQQGKAQGMSDDEAAMRASMLTGIMPRTGMGVMHPIQGDYTGAQAAQMGATMLDGSAIVPDDKTHYTLMKDAFNRIVASPAKASAIGNKVAWIPDSKSSTGYSQIRINQYNERVGEPQQGVMPPAAYLPKLKSGGTMIDEDGNTHSYSETKVGLGGGGKSGPPPHPTSDVTAAAGGGRLAWEVKKAQATAEARAGVLTAPTRTMMETAPKVIDFIDRMIPMIDQQKAQLGPAASRWSEFMAGKVGAPNPEFTKLRTNAALLSTLLMRMHVGARGSQQIMAHFQDLMDTSKQSPENLKAALEEIKSYAQDVQKSKGTGDMGGTFSGPIAVDAQGNQVQWNGKAWVPVNGKQ